MHKGSQMTVEQRERVSVARKDKGVGNTCALGYRHTPEALKKISVASRDRRASPETRARLSVVAQGRRLTTKTRAKLAEAATRQESVWGPTRIHYDLANFLADAGLRVALEVSFGRARVDIYLLDHHLAVEADGRYYHDLTERIRPGYYARRDAELLRRFDLPTARFVDVEIRGLVA